jgi:ABC-type multidrug transport system ATPase subunit
VLLSSHVLDDVEKICDEVAIVVRGCVALQGSIAEFAAGGAPKPARRTNRVTSCWTASSTQNDKALARPPLLLRVPQTRAGSRSSSA